MQQVCVCGAKQVFTIGGATRCSHQFHFEINFVNETFSARLKRFSMLFVNGVFSGDRVFRIDNNWWLKSNQNGI